MSTDTMPVSLAERVQEVVEETIAGTPVFVVEVVVRGRQGSRVLDVFLDSDDTLGVDQLAQISREIGLVLESGDIVSGAYRLNVSTPGVDRPLVPRQWPKNVGRKVRVRYADGDSVRTSTGTLSGVDAEKISLSDPKEPEVMIPTSSIQEIKVVLPW